MGNTRDFLLTDIQNFLSREPEYRRLGVPYRRGYLLHGPPGCGKSSFIYALAGELDVPICLCSLSNRALGDDALLTLLNSAPSPAIILLEDVDRAFGHGISRVTLSGLLNALDGVAAQEGNLLFMTTNHKEKLDAALIRPGRVDIDVEIGYANRDQVQVLFSRFYPQATQEMAVKFSKAVPDGQLSMARLQGYFFERMDQPERALQDADQLA